MPIRGTVLVAFACAAFGGCGRSTSSASVCPNGVIEVGEACDDGNASNRDDCSNICTVINHIAAGANHTCGLLNGQVKCWGNGARGQLGRNDTVSINEPDAMAIVWE